jgi:hypothetical protein
MVADRASTRIDQTDLKSPTVMKGAILTVKASRPPQVHWLNTVQATAQAKNSRPVVMVWETMFPDDDRRSRRWRRPEAGRRRRE